MLDEVKDELCLKATDKAEAIINRPPLLQLEIIR